MKTLKTIIMGLALMAVCGIANAKILTNGENLTKNHAINTYVDAMTRGKVDGLNDVLAKTAAFSMLRGKEVLSFSKKQMVDYLQKSGVKFGADLNANTSFNETVYQLPIPTDTAAIFNNGFKIGEGVRTFKKGGLFS